MDAPPSKLIMEKSIKHTPASGSNKTSLLRFTNHMIYDHLHSIKFLTCLLILIISFSFQKSFAESESDILLEQGIALYDKEDYNQAKNIFEKLIKVSPNNSNYHLWLGRSYGRIAENANWLKAISMAKKTRKAFEKAVELDETNIDALEDLMQYYLEAPGFLGGSKKKASVIHERLDRLSKKS